MHKLNSKLVLTAALSAALLAGCGGGSSSNADGPSSFGVFPAAPVTPGTPGTPGTPDLGQSIAAVFEYISRLIASNSENSDPVDVNVLTLATDETSSPTPLP